VYDVVRIWQLGNVIIVMVIVDERSINANFAVRNTFFGNTFARVLPSPSDVSRLINLTV